ncbi:MAG: diguanylate cyclase [Candidatus Competibacteraceae bacterium]
MLLAQGLAKRGAEMIDLVRDALGGKPFRRTSRRQNKGDSAQSQCPCQSDGVIALVRGFTARPLGQEGGIHPPAFQNDLALGYQIVKAQLDEAHRINALLRAGQLNRSAMRRAEVYKAVGDSLTEVIDFDGFAAVLRQIEEVMVCTASSAKRLIEAIWRDENHSILYATHKPTLLGDAHKSRFWGDNSQFFQVLHPGSAIHLGFHAENTPVHIILTHHAVNGFDLADRDILDIMSPCIRQYLKMSCGHLRQMEKLATTDSLTESATGAISRNWQTLELARSKRFGRPTGILMIDADHFKNINDRYGHDAGDAALQQLTATVRHELREADSLLGAWGRRILAVLVVEADRCKGHTGG